MERQPCQSKGCFATFDGGAARAEETRYCNRSGPDGGHVHRWDGRSWQCATGMQHDRS